VSARRPRARAALLALALVLTGCAGAVGASKPRLADEAYRAIDLLESRWQAFSDLRTLVELELQRGQRRRAFRGVLLVQAPASLRFEALSPLGQPLLVLVVHEGQLTVYDATAHEALVAPATADTAASLLGLPAASLLGLPVEPAELVGVLVGRPLPPSDVRGARFLRTDDHGRSLELRGPQSHVQVWMDFETGVVRQLELSGVRSEARVTYRRDPVGQPLGFDIGVAKDFLTGSVRYEQPVFDGGIDPERFRFIAPEGTKIQQLR
jgi:outer membrane lipoprotein-sorting protein